MQWAAMGGIGYMVPKRGTLVVGSSFSLLFDVLSGFLISSEGVCFFFLPKPGLGVASGQVEGGTLRAMNHREHLANKGIGGLGEVCMSTWG